MDQSVMRLVDIYETVSVNESKHLWVFGYGSLLWNPGFTFKKAVMGCIKGYARRFWQGNNTHRGTEEKPGRVATLVKDEESTVHGVAFLIHDDDALNYLTKRECELGGYIAELTTFYPTSNERPLTSILYIATSENSLWLGDAPLCDIANQVTDCSGPSGHNVEYVLRLANFMHHHFPGANDDHLFTLEKFIKMYIEDKRLCFTTLMGSGQNLITFIKRELNTDQAENNEERAGRFQFATTLSDKTLRCLNI